MLTAGHSPGHLSVVVADGNLEVFLAGDTSYTEKALLDQAVDGVSSMVGGEAAALASIRRVREFVGDVPLVYLPAHDLQSRERLEPRSVLSGSLPHMAPALASN